MKNPAHEVMKAIGLAHYCGTWVHTQNFKNLTPKKKAFDIECKRIKKEAGVASVLRNYFTRKNFERIQARNA